MVTSFVISFTWISSSRLRIALSLLQERSSIADRGSQMTRPCGSPTFCCSIGDQGCPCSIFEWISSNFKLSNQHRETRSFKCEHGYEFLHFQSPVMTEEELCVDTPVTDAWRCNCVLPVEAVGSCKVRLAWSLGKPALHQVAECECCVSYVHLCMCCTTI